MSVEEDKETRLRVTEALKQFQVEMMKLAMTEKDAEKRDLILEEIARAVTKQLVDTWDGVQDGK